MHEEAFKWGVLHWDITLTNLLILVTPLAGASAGFLTDWGFAEVDKDKLRHQGEPSPPTPWPNMTLFQRGTEQDDTLHCTASENL